MSEGETIWVWSLLKELPSWHWKERASLSIATDHA